MKTLVVLISIAFFSTLGIAESGFAEPNAENDTTELYEQIGTDPTFQELLEQRAFPIGRNSNEGVTGSKIVVNKEVVERGENAKNHIPQDIAIHTLCNSIIPRKDFAKWTRWYQEDGNSQIFRLFKDEHNVRNAREGAARVEAFSRLKWKHGEWHDVTAFF